jgi:hypothetical protein
MLPIVHLRNRSNPFLVVALICVALAGCGGDDEEQAKTTPTVTSETSKTSDTPAPPTERTDTDKKRQRTDKARTETVAPPPTTGNTPNPPIPTEKLPVPKRVQQRGDEQPAQSLALFMANGSRITPRVVRVPPFISVRVVLLATDGRAHALDFGAKRVASSPTLSSVAKLFPGLKPGKVLVGRVIGGHGTVRIEANADPGP